MNDDILTYAAEPALTRWVYGKTALIIIGVLLLLHFSGQWRTPPLINYRISMSICLVLGLFTLFGLTRAPITQRLTIDYGRKMLVIDYMTLTRLDNTLEIPFARLGLNLNKDFGSKVYGSKWRAGLLVDGQEKYALFSSEEGFSEAQLNEFIEKINAITTQ